MKRVSTNGSASARTDADAVGNTVPVGSISGGSVREPLDLVTYDLNLLRVGRLGMLVVLEGDDVPAPPRSRS